MDSHPSSPQVYTPAYGARQTVKYSLSLRSILVGLLIGILVNVSNTYYGLRVGSGSQMPMISGTLGFALFKLLATQHAPQFTRQENVLLISVATAVGCMPITSGTTGIIPALEFLNTGDQGGLVSLSFGKLLIWSVGVAFFGIVFAYFLREPLVLKSTLPWPGPYATTCLLSTLHIKSAGERQPSIGEASGSSEETGLLEESLIHPSVPPAAVSGGAEWQLQITKLLQGSLVSMIISIVMYFLPILRQLPIFGLHASEFYSWNMDLSPGFIGQGFIIGPVVAFHLLCGAITGWGILAPYAKSQGWAPGTTDEWIDGTRGWTIWVALTVFLVDSTIKCGWLLVESLWRTYPSARRELGLAYSSGQNDANRSRPASPAGSYVHNSSTDHLPSRDSELEDSSLAKEVSASSLSLGHFTLAFFVAVGLCIITTDISFKGIIPGYFTVLALVLSLPAVVIGIRSLAEIDVNPEITIRECSPPTSASHMLTARAVTQIMFALLMSRSSASAVIANLVVAGLTKASTNQSGDIAYDLKVGFMNNAHPDAQLIGHLIGSAFGAVVSCITYKMYSTQYQIPGPQFQAPSAYLLLSTARLLLGKGLPPGVLPFMYAAGVISAVAAVVKIWFKRHWWQNLIPSGIAFTMGTYLLPAFSISRVLGGVCAWYLERYDKSEHSKTAVLASGLIVGESVASLLNMGLTALGVPQLRSGEI